MMLNATMLLVVGTVILTTLPSVIVDPLPLLPLSPALPPSLWLMVLSVPWATPKRSLSVHNSNTSVTLDFECTFAQVCTLPPVR